MSRLTNVARRLRTDQTEAEQRLWSKLRNRRFMGLKFKRQEMIDRFIFDFVCEERGLIIELDGGQHAESIEQDRARSDVLEARGYLVKRYWNNDVLSNTEGVLRDIEELLK